MFLTYILQVHISNPGIAIDGSPQQYSSHFPRQSVVVLNLIGYEQVTVAVVLVDKCCNNYKQSAIFIYTYIIYMFYFINFIQFSN